MSDFLALVQALQLALKAILMYTEVHPRSQSALTSLAGHVGRWLQDKPSLHIAASAGKVFLDGAPFDTKHVHLTNLARQLTERQISGFILQRGVTAEELAGLLDLLILKPSRIEEAGGPAAILAKRPLPHIQLSMTQYKEVHGGAGDAEEARPSPGKGWELAGTSTVSAEAAEAALAAMAALAGSGPGTPPAPPGAAPSPRALPGFTSAAGAASPPPSPLFDFDVLVSQWKEQLALLPRPELGTAGGFAPASLGFLGGSPLSIGMGDGFPAAHQIEGLRRALLDLPPETLLSVVAGQDSLPVNPGGLRLAFQALNAQTFAEAASGLMAGEAPWEGSKEALFGTLRYAPTRQAMLTALEAELRARGISMATQERFEDLVRQLEWEAQSLDDKIHMALHHDQLWTLTLGQRLAFLRRLLDEGRIEAFLGLLDQILHALAQDNASLRERAAQTLTGVAHWMVDPGLPMEAEGPLFQGLTAHFGWEPLVNIHRATTEALDLALGSLVARGEPGQALSLLRELSGLCEFHESRHDWREAALAGLWGRLSDPASLHKVIELLHTANPETMLNELIPYLEAAGESACRLLVDCLGQEPERKRRARLIEAIRGLGDLALPAVFEGLDSPSWFLVRNTLNLLSDMGDAGALKPASACLAHPDGRVKRAAVRTLWRVGGPAAVAPLLAALPTVDPETQMEIMFALGQVRSAQAVPALAGYMEERRNPDRLRARAAETLGQIGDPKAIPLLAEVAKRKGRIFTSAEPPEVRVAACRALKVLGTPVALEALRTTVAAEPWNKERRLLQQVLDEHRPI